MTRTLRIFALLALLLSVPHIARAAEQVPGDSCTGAEENNFMRSGGKEIPTGHFIVCKSGTWRSILSWDAAAAVTKIGNLTCTNGQVLKFNGTTWACAADDAGSGGITALTGDVTGSGSGSVAATIANNAVVAAKIASNAVTEAKIASGAVTTAKIADAAVSIPKIGATGTPSPSVFLRGDGQWAAVPAGGGITGQTTQTCTSINGCTASCPAGYFRSGCSATAGGTRTPHAQPSGVNACTCSSPNGNVTCYVYCIN